MDFDEQEDEEMGMGPTASYDSLGNPNQETMVKNQLVVQANNNNYKKKAKYRECLKNHAVAIGGHALDGCGEFLPAGADGTIDALKCAACNCHRNFHRKETDPTAGMAAMEPYLLTNHPHFHHHHHQPPPPPPRHHQFSAYYRTAPAAGYLHVGRGPPPSAALALPSTSGAGCGAHSNMGEDHEEDVSGGGDDGGVMRKRYRTKFTQEQKEGMMGLAERLGWRIQKHDESVVQQFCEEMGVRRHVLKVWMHNNKHTLGKKP